jgi:membrane protein implicated in regulation of membrane protease activity
MEPIWIWAAIGIILLAFEMATGTFYLLWFGISALCITFAMWLFPNMSAAMQYITFAILSLSSLALWRFNYKKNSINSPVGQSQGTEIGRVGTVIKTASPKQNGKIQFTQGLMGSREWTAIADETIEAGTEATVIAVIGNALKISKN